ncbi:MAG: DUF1566 domain-containing protein [Nitrospirae bacterium]|uniref:Lcl domain-containing protein n=1 Tax=Candidatus Magnetobacterium casense TaxID=1455061 RepID=UPI0005917E1D|nr:DUF1566 domain-containing protein [Candidatus Magnetobacterium casensis]MBF0338468.1 DUF1566 domain-containing protein [Nitrospirota bacterium]
MKCPNFQCGRDISKPGKFCPYCGTSMSVSASTQQAVKPQPMRTPTRFVDNGDQTITDTSTGLMWTKDANFVGWKTWQGALDYVASMNTGAGTYGYIDWRLPTIQELYTLCRKDGSQVGLDKMLSNGKRGYCNGVAVDVASLLVNAGFTNVPSGGYWSSTTVASDTSLAWFVYMGVGVVGANHRSNLSYVWPVRSGH